jgi:hypothetical protein
VKSTIFINTYIRKLVAVVGLACILWAACASAQETTRMGAQPPADPAIQRLWRDLENVADDAKTIAAEDASTRAALVQAMQANAWYDRELKAAWRKMGAHK